MSTQQQPTLRGIRLTDNGDGTYTLTHSGDGSVDAATAAVHSALVTTFPEVGVLVRDVVEGRRGKAAPFEDAPYRRVTVQSVRFRPETLIARRVWIGPHDGGEPQLNSDWS